MNIADIVRVHARRSPTATALVDGRVTLDWAGLQARIEAAAWHLRAAGLQPGDVVGISLRQPIAQCVAALAVVRSGATACLLDWRARPEESAATLQTLQLQLVVRNRAAEGTAGVPVVVLGEAWSVLPPGQAAPPAIDDPEAPAFLILSSGTTGAPKAVVMNHEAMGWRMAVRQHEVAMRSGMRTLGAMPLTGSAGLTSLLCQLLAGAATWFLPGMATIDQLVEILRSQRIEHVTLVPTMVRGLLDLAPPSGVLLPDIATLVTLGAAFHAEEKQTALARLTPNLLDHYGSAGAGAIAFADASEMRRNPGSVGRLAMFTRLQIVDEAGQVLPTGEVGRIRVRSPTMAQGYHRGTGREERDEIFHEGWAYPGDLGRLDENGLLFIEGRAASVIIRGGQNIYPEEIERVLLSHPAVAEAAVVGRADVRLGEVPVALLVGRESLDPGNLAGYCRARLQPAKVPVAFHQVDALPRTATGKVRRAALPELLATSGDA